MSTNGQVVQSNKDKLDKILNFPFGPSEPVPTTAKKTTSVSQASTIKKRTDLDRLLGL